MDPDPQHGNLLLIRIRNLGEYSCHNTRTRMNILNPDEQRGRISRIRMNEY